MEMEAKPELENPELWIGVVHVRPRNQAARDGILDGAAGAVTKFLAWARNPAEFRGKVEATAKTMDLWVIEVVEERLLEETSVTEEIEDMLLEVESNPEAIAYGTLNLYMQDDA
jgi:hypothetical protein